MNKKLIDALLVGCTIVACVSIITCGVLYSQLQETKQQLDTQKEMLYAPTTKQQCLDGTQLGFDAYVKGKDGDTNYILSLAKTRNADSRTIAVAYSVYSEIVNINLVVGEAAKNFGFKQGDEMAVARARRDVSWEQCNTIE